MTEKRVIYAQALQLTDPESRAFWPIYDGYEARVKKIDDRFVQLVNDYAAKYSTMTDADALRMLAAKMKIDKERMDLQQAYTEEDREGGAGGQGAALCAGRVAHRQRTAAQGHAAGAARPVNRGSAPIHP